MKKVDLHCHTTHSDGTLTPLELVEKAISIGLDALAITDHDTFTAFFEVVPSLQKTPFIVLPGVEISTELGKENVHVLGYSFNPKSCSLQEFCRMNRDHRLERNSAILEKLTVQGMPLTEEDIKDPTGQTVSYGRPHIAQAMMKKGYVKSVQEAFVRYLGEGKPCYVSMKKWTPQDAIHAIHEAHGVAVIAHPHLISRSSTIKALLEMPFDGIECYYSRCSGAMNAKWERIADEKKWLKTGGSDFHGGIKPEILLGCALAPAATYEILLERAREFL